MRAKLLFTILFLLLISETISAQTYEEKERLLWLSRIWQDVSQNFYDPQRLIDIKWDETYVEYISLVREAENDEAYFALLQRFMATVEDGHTEFISLASVDNKSKKYKLPLNVIYIRNKYYVIGWVSKYFNDIVLPQELVSVNGEPFEQYLENNYFPYVSGSTAQWKRLKALELFSKSDINKSLEVELVSLDGNQSIHTIDYVLPVDISKGDIEMLKSPFSNSNRFDLLDDVNGNKLLLFDLKSFRDIPITKILTSLPDQVGSANYIVVDLRMNSGGNELIADTLLMSLLPIDTLKTYPTQTRVHNALKAAQGYGYMIDYRDYYLNTAIEIIPDAKFIKPGTDLPTLNQPLYVLVSEKTYSAAEDFILPLRLHYPDRAVIIGTSTGGSTGAPLVREMPGKCYYRVCTRGTLIDGDYNTQGIIPDIYYDYSIDDYLNNNDSIPFNVFQRMCY